MDVAIIFSGLRSGRPRHKLSVLDDVNIGLQPV